MRPASRDSGRATPTPTTAPAPSTPALSMASSPKICPLCGTAYDAGALFCQRDGSRLTAALGAPDPFVGTVLLDQFRIDEAVGQGGMGTVYRATQTTLGRHVAVKILHPELTQNPDAVRRFHREARVATALEHPNLVRVFLFGELPEDQGLYLVMEFLEGRSLTTLLREDGALPLGRALHLATQIADAVGHAHGKGIVHRDVKPENVHVVTRHGDPDFVKVLDFGIARLLWDDQSVMTQSGVIFGTARYISPEGAAGETTDARSDVYSIGVLLYQLLAGRTPFDASSPVAMLMKHIHDTPRALSRRVKNVPSAVEDVVMRALAKRPEARYANAAELAEALRAAAATTGLALRPRLGQRPSLAPGVLPGAGPTPTPVTGPGQRLSAGGLRRRHSRGIPPAGSAHAQRRHHRADGQCGLRRAERPPRTLALRQLGNHAGAGARAPGPAPLGARRRVPFGRRSRRRRRAAGGPCLRGERDGVGRPRRSGPARPSPKAASTRRQATTCSTSRAQLEGAGAGDAARELRLRAAQALRTQGLESGAAGDLATAPGAAEPRAPLWPRACRSQRGARGVRARRGHAGARARAAGGDPRAYGVDGAPPAGGGGACGGTLRRLSG